jgi:hypothetical protein
VAKLTQLHAWLLDAFAGRVSQYWILMHPSTSNTCRQQGCARRASRSGGVAQPSRDSLRNC